MANAFFDATGVRIRQAPMRAATASGQRASPDDRRRGGREGLPLAGGRLISAFDRERAAQSVPLAWPHDAGQGVLILEPRVVFDRPYSSTRVARQIVGQRHVELERRVTPLQLEVIVDRRSER